MAAQTEKLIDLDQEDPVSSPMNEIELYRYWQDRVKESKLVGEANDKTSKSTTKGDLNPSENLKLARMYNELIHSGKYTEQLMKLEYSYRPAVEDMFNTRDISLDELQSKSSKEIEAAISQLGQTHTESDRKSVV